MYTMIEFMQAFEGDYDEWITFCTEHQITNEEAMRQISRCYGQDHLDQLLEEINYADNTRTGNPA